MIYIISYDLNNPGQNYERLHKSIKNCGQWAKFLDSTWLVDTSLTANGIYQHLKVNLDDNDRVLIIGVTRDYSGWLPKEAWAWIEQRLSRMAA